MFYRISYLSLYIIVNSSFGWAVSSLKTLQQTILLYDIDIWHKQNLAKHCQPSSLEIDSCFVPKLTKHVCMVYDIYYRWLGKLLKEWRSKKLDLIILLMWVIALMYRLDQNIGCFLYCNTKEANVLCKHVNSFNFWYSYIHNSLILYNPAVSTKSPIHSYWFRFTTRVANGSEHSIHEPKGAHPFLTLGSIK